MSDWEGMPKDRARLIVEYAQALPDEEVCGFMLRGWKIEPVLNRAEDRSVTFSFDIDHLMKIMSTQKDAVLGIFHSHPHGNPHPSDRDCYLWPYGKMFRYWIVADSDVYEWEIEDGLAHPVTQRGERGAGGLAYPILAAPEAL